MDIAKKGFVLTLAPTSADMYKKFSKIFEQKSKNSLKKFLKRHKIKK